ncbi:25402_t:CDS:2, partial [Dentiscutata erythropus]
DQKEIRINFEAMTLTKKIIKIKPTNQVVEVVKYLAYDALYEPDDVILITVTCMSKARPEVASILSIISIIQYSCAIVLSGHMHDVIFDLSLVIIPFTWLNKSIRDVLYANQISSIALELVSRECRLTAFRRNEHNRRDDWYDQIKNWRKYRFHLILNELVENVSAHAELEQGRFCFTTGSLFANKKTNKSYLEILSGAQEC